MWKCVKLLIWMTLLWIFKKKTELPKSVLFVSKFEFEKKKKKLLKWYPFTRDFLQQLLFETWQIISYIFQTYLLRPSGKVRLYYLRLLSCRQYVFTVCYPQPCVSGLPAPSVRLRQRVWHVFWIRAQGLYRAQEQGPLCALFFTFLSPDISPVPGRTLKWLCAGRGPLDLCSLASVPWFGGGPYHPSQSPHNNAIKGMLYIPHVVLQQKLDG